MTDGVYHRGYLPIDCGDEARRKTDLTDEQKSNCKLRDAMWRRARKGQVHLVQKRHGELDYSYLALPIPPKEVKP
tara:strand:- start:241 stop:465 length:225 start_codon:yes stop_codon:yes gene_type:complete